MISTILEWVQSILGEYEPIKYTLTQGVAGTDGNIARITSNVIPNGLAGVNIEYLVTACLLLIVIYSVFRLMGVLLQGLLGGRRV